MNKRRIHVSSICLMLLAALFTAAAVIHAAAVAAFAAEDYTITIRNARSDHSYEAFQILRGNLASDGQTLTDIVWGSGVDGEALLASLKSDGELAGRYEEVETAEAFAEATVGISDAQVDHLAEVIGSCLTGVSFDSGEQVDEAYLIHVDSPGYYLVRDAGAIPQGDAATRFILQVCGDVQVEAKADAPELEKYILENGTRVKSNSVSVGDAVTYELVSSVPDMNGYEKYFFIMHDTLSEGLDFQPDTVEVKIGDDTLDEGAYDVVTKGMEDGCTFEIVFKDFLQNGERIGDEVSVTYDAILNEKAEVGVEGNLNLAHLEYSNNPNVTPEGTDRPGDDDETGETPERLVITYTVGITILKKDAKTGESLPGADFVLRGEKVNMVKITVDGTTTWTEKTEEVEIHGITGEDGTVQMAGLGAGNYILSEYAAPDGYNKLSEDIEVHIRGEYPEGAVSGDETATWYYTLSGAVVQEETEAPEGIVRIQVDNREGLILPVTGGEGTVLVRTAGVIFLVVGAVIGLCIRKRTGA